MQFVSSVLRIASLRDICFLSAKITQIWIDELNGETSFGNVVTLEHPLMSKIRSGEFYVILGKISTRISASGEIWWVVKALAEHVFDMGEKDRVYS
jgi:hypothetical protein